MEYDHIPAEILFPLNFQTPILVLHVLFLPCEDDRALGFSNFSNSNFSSYSYQPTITPYKKQKCDNPTYDRDRGKGNLIYQAIPLHAKTSGAWQVGYFDGNDVNEMPN